MRLSAAFSTLALLGTFLVSMTFPDVASAQTQEGDYVDPVLGIDFVHIPEGTFLMGDLTGRGDPRERPVHQVTVGDFFMSKYEITFAQYDKYCEATGRDKPRDQGWGRGQRPVINVSWQDAVTFTLWLSDQTGRHIRLPSEAQWEYAARAGTSTPYWWGHRMLPNMANCRDCVSPFHQQTAPVGSFSPNPFGLYDMAGNVWEWVLDNFQGEEAAYNGAPTDGSPWYGGETRWKLNRGGSYNETSEYLRVTERNWDNYDARPFCGLRLVLEP